MIFLGGCNHGIPMAVMGMLHQGSVVILKAWQQTQEEVMPSFQIAQNAGKAWNKISQAKYPLVLLTQSLLLFVFRVLFRDPLESKQHWNWSTQMKPLAIYLWEGSKIPSFSKKEKKKKMFVFLPIYFLPNNPCSAVPFTNLFMAPNHSYHGP